MIAQFQEVIDRGLKWPAMGTGCRSAAFRDSHRVGREYSCHTGIRPPGSLRLSFGCVPSPARIFRPWPIVGNNLSLPTLRNLTASSVYLQSSAQGWRAGRGLEEPWLMGAQVFPVSTGPQVSSRRKRALSFHVVLWTRVGRQSSHAWGALGAQGPLGCDGYVFGVSVQTDVVHGQ